MKKISYFLRYLTRKLFGSNYDQRKPGRSQRREMVKLKKKAFHYGLVGKDEIEELCDDWSSCVKAFATASIAPIKEKLARIIASKERKERKRALPFLERWKTFASKLQSQLNAAIAGIKKKYGVLANRYKHTANSLAKAKTQLDHIEQSYDVVPSKRSWYEKKKAILLFFAGLSGVEVLLSLDAFDVLSGSWTLVSGTMAWILSLIMFLSLDLSAASFFKRNIKTAIACFSCSLLITAFIITLRYEAEFTESSKHIEHTTVPRDVVLTSTEFGPDPFGDDDQTNLQQASNSPSIHLLNLGNILMLLVGASVALTVNRNNLLFNYRERVIALTAQLDQETSTMELRDQELENTLENFNAMSYWQAIDAESELDTYIASDEAKISALKQQISNIKDSTEITIKKGISEIIDAFNRGKSQA